MNLQDFTLVKIEIYAPLENIDAIRLALEKSHAGVIGNYDNCFATSEVKGHWRPLKNANPYIGTIGEIETAREIKLEVNCHKKYVPAVLKTVRAVHPYEEPLINVLPVINFLFE